MQSTLDDNIIYLKGVGPQKANVLASELGVKTYGDLLYHFPYKYLDRTKFYTINELNGDLNYVQVKGKIIHFETLGEGRKLRLSATFSDGNGAVKLVWFKGVKWVKDKLKINTEYIIFGKPTVFNNSINLLFSIIKIASAESSKSFLNKSLLLLNSNKFMQLTL